MVDVYIPTITYQKWKISAYTSDGKIDIDLEEKLKRDLKGYTEEK